MILRDNRPCPWVAIPSAHRAAVAVTRHHVAGADRLLGAGVDVAHRSRDGLGVLGESDDLGGVLDQGAQHLGPLREHGFENLLG